MIEVVFILVLIYYASKAILDPNDNTPSWWSQFKERHNIH